MLKKKRKLEKNLNVNVLLVLILAVTFACKRVPSQPASEHTNKTHSTHNHKKGPLLYIPSSRYICIEYYHNFAKKSECHALPLTGFHPKDMHFTS